MGFSYHKSRATLTVICHLEVYLLTGALSQAVPHSGPVGTSPHWHPGHSRLIGSALYFCIYIDCRVAFHERALYMLFAQWIMFLHAWNSIYGSPKMQAPAGNAIKFNSAINTRRTGLKAREQSGRVSEHPLTLLTLQPPSQSSQASENPSPLPCRIVNCGQFEWSTEDNLGGKGCHREY